MSDTRPPLDLDAIRERHVAMLDESVSDYMEYCAHCGDPWPCDVPALIAEVERLRALDTRCPICEGGTGDTFCEKCRA